MNPDSGDTLADHVMTCLLLSLMGALPDAGPLDAGAPLTVHAADWCLDGGSDGRASKAVAPRSMIDRPVDAARVSRVLASLDTRARAGQLLLAYPQVDKTTPVEVGGVVFVGNLLRKPEQAKARIDWSKAHAQVPPFFAIDMEGGPSNRMKRVKEVADLPSAKEMSTLSDVEVWQWGARVGLAMREVGLNLNLAPVLDVAGSGHMARNTRSFGGDKSLVARKAAAYAKGLLEQGVMPFGKHFPGYGDIEGDSDHALVTTDWSKARVLEEISVFDEVHEQLGGVMLANVVYPSIENVPAILSPVMVREAHARGFVTVTDDISIQLLADAIGGSGEDVLVKAFLAGNDLLLTTAPPDWSKGLDYLGILTRTAEASPQNKALLDESCTRVLRLKDRMGLLDGR